MQMAPERSQGGYILIFSLFLLMGISATAVGMLYNAKHARIAAQNYKNRIKAFTASEGIQSLIGQEILDGNGQAYLKINPRGMIKGEVWDDVQGIFRSDLHVVKSGSSNRQVTSDYLGSNWKWKANYAVRWSGLLFPPVTGAYTFMLRSDDASEFYLSNDETSRHLSKNPVAWLDSYQATWPTSGTGVSRQIRLDAGKRYYFEFLHKQGGGPGYGQVGWKGPEFLTERPISGGRLAPADAKFEGWDTAAFPGGKVQYSLSEFSAGTFAVSTEAIAGGKGDSSARAPLHRILHTRADAYAPPDSLWQHVIYYDFHANLSNPEFERADDTFLPFLRSYTGMVQAKGLRYEKQNADWFGLDDIGKPRLANPKYNCGVDKWFTPWKPGWFRTYAYAAGPGDCREKPVAHDTAFINRVIKDSLPFRLRKDLGTNVYQFSHVAPDPAFYTVNGFFPLNRRGFGGEGVWYPDSGHINNYGFCMEMHTLFEHTSGLTFQFNGDDDAWLYINDSLVMDLGYIHPPLSGGLNLDDLPLKFGDTYHFDFFFCERRTGGSSMELTINLPLSRKLSRASSNWKREYGELD